MHVGRDMRDTGCSVQGDVGKLLLEGRGRLVLIQIFILALCRYREKPLLLCTYIKNSKRLLRRVYNNEITTFDQRWWYWGGLHSSYSRRGFSCVTLERMQRLKQTFWTYLDKTKCFCVDDSGCLEAEKKAVSLEDKRTLPQEIGMGGKR